MRADVDIHDLDSVGPFRNVVVPLMTRKEGPARDRRIFGPARDRRTFNLRGLVPIRY